MVRLLLLPTYSNTTLVNVKYEVYTPDEVATLHSNTTIVNVKFLGGGGCTPLVLYSNTTIVNVKYNPMIISLFLWRIQIQQLLMLNEIKTQV